MLLHLEIMDISYISLLAGYIVIAVCLFDILLFAWKMIRCYVLTRFGFVKDLRKYGEWAVVTGATDGIGKEYARQFAKRGFPVVLISRTKSKLDRVSDEIKNEFSVETKMIEFDFKECGTGYERIREALQDLDIGILVNNVGMSCLGSFQTTAMNTANEILHVNMFPAIYVTNMVLKGMVERKRGAVVYISSASIHFDLYIHNVYPPTKCFLSKFVKSMQLEYSGIVDHQLVITGYVATKMSKKKSQFGIPSAEEYAKSAIQTIGISDITGGYWFHECLGFLGYYYTLITGWRTVIRKFSKW